MLLKNGHGFWSTPVEPQSYSIAFFRWGKSFYPCHIIVHEESGISCRFRTREQASHVFELGYGELVTPLTVYIPLSKFEPINNFLLFSKVISQPVEFPTLRDEELISYYNITVSSDAIWNACKINKKLDAEISYPSYALILGDSYQIAMRTNLIVERVDFKNFAIEFYGDDGLFLCNKMIQAGSAIDHEDLGAGRYRIYMKDSTKDNGLKK